MMSMTFHEIAAANATRGEQIRQDCVGRNSRSQHMMRYGLTPHDHSVPPVTGRVASVEIAECAGTWSYRLWDYCHAEGEFAGKRALLVERGGFSSYSKASEEVASAVAELNG